MPGKVLIDGGSGGIGSATARALRTRGCDLHLVVRDDVKLAAAAFLICPESAWITGQVIGVDGGRSSVRTKG